jgi:hypothetical protein
MIFQPFLRLQQMMILYPKSMLHCMCLAQSSQR